MAQLFTFTEPSMDNESSRNNNFSLTWHDLTVRTQRKKTVNKLKLLMPSFYAETEEFNILDNVSGKAESGSLVAVIGASGSGKTTLLTAISRRLRGNVEGQVLLNGQPVDRKLLAGISGFVPQLDITIDTLTVKQHLQFMSQMRLDKDVSSETRQKWIHGLLLELGLKSCEETLIRALSGGERKRLSLAVELLTDPPILFCDEPTTGLDSYSALTVVEKLRKLANRGKVVICSIHQPASDTFSCFHELMLLSGGRVAYHGSLPNAPRYFASLGLVCPLSYNPAEFYIQQLAVSPFREEECLVRIARICDAFAVSEQNQSLKSYSRKRATVSEITDSQITHQYDKYTTIRKPSWHIVLYWLTWRYLLDGKRHLFDNWSHIVIFLMSSLVLATLFMKTISTTQEGVQDTRGLIYFITSEVYYSRTYCVFNTFPGEIHVYLRERDLYPASTYYIAKIITLMPRVITESVVFLALMCIFVAGDNSISFITFVGPVLVAAFAATAYGCMLSAVFESPDMALTFSTPVDLVVMLMSGVYYNIRTLSVGITWIKYLSLFYYFNEVLSVLHWQNIADIKCREDSNLPCLSNGQQVLEDYGFLPANMTMDLIAMVLFIVILNLIGYCGIVRQSWKYATY